MLFRSNEKKSWNGFDRYDFFVDGRACIAVEPNEKLEQPRCVWRARFFGSFPIADLALLEIGFHIVYTDVVDLYGSPKAVAHWNKFYKYLTDGCGFPKKVNLEGLSRGGLIVLNWAIENPEKVASIYIDAPVCDFKSWPGGKGIGDGSPTEWKKCLQAYNLSEAEALKYPTPIDRIAPLAKADVPILSICGDIDTAVPFEENTKVLAERYRELGGKIEVILKENCGHHPHGLENPEPILKFITKYAL